MQNQSADLVKEACQEMVEMLLAKDNLSKDEFMNIKRTICAKHRLRNIPPNSAVLSLLNPEIRGRLRMTLMIKPTRTASGIAVIAVMSRPHVCPAQAKCVYCPGGVDSGSPKSYTGFEPAALRGVQNDFDSFREVEARLKQLEAVGHRVEKSEIIIMGGTFLNFPLDYQEEFVKGCFDALNGSVSSTLDEAHLRNETALRRNVGLTFETRPDLCGESEVDLMLRYGATRVELGVQVLDDDVYRIVRRGHKIRDVAEAFRTAKDSGLKVVAHMMPGLPGSSVDKDLESFHKLFEENDFKPDMLKIYPTLVVKSSELYRMWIDGEYEPYDLTTTVNLVADIKKFVPEWVRIMRIQRDIPARLIESGVKKSNLRELIQSEVGRRGYACRCIRCREIRLKRHGNSPSFDEVEMKIVKYESSDGEDIFISFVDTVDDLLIGFIRVRIPSKYAYRKEVTSSKCCIIRELHIYGPVVPVGVRDDDSWQHRGFGKKLLDEAERIAMDEYDAKKMVVMSAVGARMYYFEAGYRVEGPYMVKEL